MKVLVERLSTALADRYVQYLDTFLVDLWSDAGFIEFRCGFSLLRDRRLRSFTLKLAAATGETDVKRETLIMVIFDEIEALVDASIAERRVTVN